MHVSSVCTRCVRLDCTSLSFFPFAFGPSARLFRFVFAFALVSSKTSKGFHGCSVFHPCRGGAARPARLTSKRETFRGVGTPDLTPIVQEISRWN